MELIDTHSHLYDEQFETDLEQVIANAKEQHISKIVLPAIDRTTHHRQIEISQEYNDIFVPLMGLHPTSVKTNYKDELNIVERYLSEHKFYGIGEIGIDLHWDKAYFKQQQDAFAIQIDWAKQLNIPIIIHTRSSFDETFKIVEKKQDGSLTGIFHCFGGTREEAEKIIKIGFNMGIGGVVTFKNSDLDQTLKEINLKHLVLETDSPYLAPVPYRGKRNESAYVSLVADKLSEVYNISVEQIAEQTTATAKNIFKI